MSDLYYTPPDQKYFNEVKRKSIEIWRTYDDTFGYATGKIDKIKDLKNVGDNFMYMVAMFDIVNQLKLAINLSEECRFEISRRIKAGGTPDIYNMFIKTY